MTINTIREDLKDIRYYFSRKDFFEKVYSKVGENAINEKIEKFNDIVRFAPPRLYDIYVSLYLENNTQESLAEKLGYSLVYISQLNRQLIRFFLTQFKEKGVEV